MNLFSKIKNTTIDWATGNSYNYKNEEEVYKELIDLLTSLETKLDLIISKSTFIDEWATFEVENIKYTLPFLKSIITETLKSKTMKDGFDYAYHLQKTYDEYELKIKENIINGVLIYENLEEVYWILIDLKKIIVSNLVLPAIKEINYNDMDKLPSYEMLCQLKNKISERMSIILPYLADINYNKR